MLNRGPYAGLCILAIAIELGSALEHTGDAPTLELADRTGFHDFDTVADSAVIGFIVDVNHGFALDLLAVKRVRDLVEIGDLDGLVAGTTGDGSDEGLAGVACSGCFHGNAVLVD